MKMLFCKDYNLHGLILVVLCIVGVSWTSDTRHKCITLEKAQSKGHITARFMATGKLSQNCVIAHITNTKADTLNVIVEAGKRLTPEDTSLQDFIIIKNDTITVPPFDSVEASIAGLCVTTRKLFPDKGSLYKTSNFDKNFPLLPLAEYFSKTNHEYIAMQSAIWVVTNGFSLASIVETDDSSQQIIRNFIAKQTKAQVPWYSILYKKDTTMCSGVPEVLFANLEYVIKANGAVSIILYDIRNRPMKVFFQYMPHTPKKYIYNLRCDVSKFTRGTYTLKILQEGVLVAKKEIQL